MTETKINPLTKVHLVITAAGSSSRMGTGTKKEYVKLQDEDNNTVLSLACFSFLNTFKNQPSCCLNTVVVTCPKNKIVQAKDALFSNLKVQKLIAELNIDLRFIEGGETRQLSVYNALSLLHDKIISDSNSDNDIVLIHDGARPWIDSTTILNVLNTTIEHGAAVPATSVTDTTALVKDGIIQKYVERSSLYNLQTPQGFKCLRLFLAHQLCAKDERTDCTDDTTLWAAYCGDVHICEGSTQNKKITFKGDI